MDTSSMDLIAFGGACKALERGAIVGHLVVFGTPGEADLSSKRDFFTPRTDFDLDGCDFKSRFLYDHGLDPTLRRRRLARAELRIDEVGVWMKAQLALRDEYEAAVYHLARLQKLGLSSGTARHLVERKAIETAAGTVHEVLTWPLGLDASATPRPADPRIVVEVKSLAAGAPVTLEEWLRDPEVKCAVDAIRESAGAGRTCYSFGAAGGGATTGAVGTAGAATTGGGCGCGGSAAEMPIETPIDVQAEEIGSNIATVRLVRSLAFLQEMALQSMLPLLVDFWPMAGETGCGGGMVPGMAAPGAGGMGAWTKGRYPGEVAGEMLPSASPIGGVDPLAGGRSPFIPSQSGQPVGEPVSAGLAGGRLALLQDLAEHYQGRLEVVVVKLAISPDIGRHYNVFDSATLLLVDARVIVRTDGPHALEMMLARLGEEIGEPNGGGDGDYYEQYDGHELKAKDPCATLKIPKGMPRFTWPTWALDRQWDGRQNAQYPFEERPNWRRAGLNPGRNPYAQGDMLPEGWEDLMTGTCDPPTSEGFTYDTKRRTLRYWGIPYTTFVQNLRRQFWCARATRIRETGGRPPLASETGAPPAIATPSATMQNGASGYGAASGTGSAALGMLPGSTASATAPVLSSSSAMKGGNAVASPGTRTGSTPRRLPDCSRIEQLLPKGMHRFTWPDEWLDRQLSDEFPELPVPERILDPGDISTTAESWLYHGRNPYEQQDIPPQSLSLIWSGARPSIEDGYDSGGQGEEDVDPRRTFFYGVPHDEFFYWLAILYLCDRARRFRQRQGRNTGGPVGVRQRGPQLTARPSPNLTLSDVEAKAAESADEGATAGDRSTLHRGACADLVLPEGMPPYTWPEWVLRKEGKDRGRVVGLVGDQAQLAGRNPYYRSDLLPENWGDLCISFTVPRLDALTRSGAESATYHGLSYEDFLTTIRMLYLCARAELRRSDRKPVGETPAVVQEEVKAAGKGYDCARDIWNTAWGPAPTFRLSALRARGANEPNPYMPDDRLPLEWRRVAHEGVRPTLEELAARVWQLERTQLEEVIEHLYLCMRGRDWTRRRSVGATEVRGHGSMKNGRAGPLS